MKTLCFVLVLILASFHAYADGWSSRQRDMMDEQVEQMNDQLLAQQEELSAQSFQATEDTKEAFNEASEED